MNRKRQIDLALGICIAALLLAAVPLWRMENAADAEEIPTVPEVFAIPEPAAAAAPKPAIAGNAVAAHDPFSRLRGAPEPAQAASAADERPRTPPPKVQFELLGLFTLGNRPGAIIGGTRRKRQLFYVGDPVENDYVLSGIDAEGATLEHPSGTIRLPLKGRNGPPQAKFTLEQQ